jgi:hypothetical protein
MGFQIVDRMERVDGIAPLARQLLHKDYA